MTTPTPGDLSARHVEVLNELRIGVEFDAHCDPLGVQKLEALDASIAALSALPAAGEPDGYTSMGEFRYTCDCDEEMRATWQPVYFKLPARTTPPPDADVGAQGEGCTIRLAADDWNPYELLDIARLYVEDVSGLEAGDELFIERIRECLRQQKRTQAASPVAEGCSKCGSEWPASECACSCIAAPPAGKGVDDVLDLATQYGDHSFGSRNRESWEFDTHGLKQFAAALTRQPVAGDGMVLVPREPTPAMLIPLVHRSFTDHWEAGKQLQSEQLRRSSAAGNYGYQDWMIPPKTEYEVAAGQYLAMLAAAPTGPAQGDGADTPADGGEG